MTESTGVGVPGGNTTFGAPATRAETLADRAQFLTAGLTPVACRNCGTTVLVRKNSPKHTSIQWVSDPATSCPVFAERAAAGGLSALVDGCDNLTESIACAAEAGLIPTQEES